VNIIEAMEDAELFGNVFRDSATWAPLRTVLKALFGLPMADDDLPRFRQHTGREVPNPDGYKEFWAVAGRRSGKSFVLALVAVFLAAFRDWRPHLTAGERGVVMVIAVDRRQAQVILGYIRGLLATPMLAGLVVNETQETIDLRDNVSIEVHTCSYRSSETSSNPDVEVLAALRPSMATVPGSMMLCASSPYARRGVLWRAYEKHYGKAGAVPLVWQAPTLAMNPTVPQSVIDGALADDEAAARAEYLAEFRSDLEAFVKLDTVEACIGSYTQRAPDSSLRYFGFVDPSGGSSDAFTLAIGHREKDEVHIDAVYAKQPPFSPSHVVDEFAEVLRGYRIRQVCGDRYGGEFPRELFRRHSIEYRIAPKSKSELYQALLPLLNSGRITLPRNDTLIKQLVGLERRVSRSGKELIDHGQRGHDDIANACAGAAELCSEANRTPMAVYGRYGTPDGPPIRQSKFDGPVPDWDPRLMRHHGSRGQRLNIFSLRRRHKAAAISTEPAAEPDGAEEVVMSDLVESEDKLATSRLEKSQ
jgi:hypothetical protein